MFDTRRVRFLSVAVLAIFAVRLAFADELSPLSFKAWKEQQLNEARGQLARLSIHPNISHTNLRGEASDDTADLPRVEKVHRAENEVKRAMENLAAAKELGIGDYFTVYLSQFRSQPEALEAVAQRLSKDEVAALLRFSLNRGLEEADVAPKSGSNGFLVGEKTRN